MILRTARRVVLSLAFVVPLLVACGGAPVTGDVASTAAPPDTTAPVEPTTAPALTGSPAAAPTTASEPTPARAASPLNDKVLVIGHNNQLGSLFRLETSSFSTYQLLHSLGVCSDNRVFEPQPTYCFDTFPTLDNGGAVLTDVAIEPDAISAERPIVVDGVLITSAAEATERGLTIPAALPQLQLTYTLNPNLRWEDGVPVTSADALESFRVQKDPVLERPSSYTIDRILSVETPDAQTVVQTYAPGALDFDYFDTFIGFLPAHVYGGMSVEEIRAIASMRPFSFGPYMIQEHRAEEQTVLVNNPYFFQQPKIGTIIWKYLTDTNQILAQLESGDIDLTSATALAPGDTPELDRLEQAGIIQTQFVTTTGWEQILFGIERSDDRPSFFADLNLRKAIAYAIDRPSIIENVLYGKTSLMNTYVPRDHPSSPTTGLEEYVHNPKRAAELLDEAGWVIGAGGIREKDGQRLAVQFYTTDGSASRKAIAEIIQQQLREVGIDVELLLVPSATLTQTGSEGILMGRRFDMALFSFAPSNYPEHALFRCDSIPTAENGFIGLNRAAYCNEEFDAAATAAARELDRVVRIEFDRQALTIFNHDLPSLPLYLRPLIVGYTPALTGLELDPSSSSQLWNVLELDIAQ